jgi:methyl-accepting chemotaxis protein
MTTPTLARLLRPGIHLMQRLSLPLRLTLVAASLGLPLVAATGFGLWRIAGDLAVTRAEQAGLALGHRLEAVLEALHEQRGLSYRTLYGDTAADADLARARAELQRRLQVADDAVRDHRGYPFDDAWQPVQRKIAQLAQGRHPIEGDASFAVHSEVMEDLLDLLTANAERSGLLLDPQPETYFLMDTVVRLVPTWLDAATRLRAQGAGHLASGADSPRWRTEMAAGMTVLQRSLRQTALALDAVERAGGSRPVSWAVAERACQVLITHTQTLLSSEELSGDASVYFALAGDASMAIARLGADSQAALGTALAERQARQARIALWLVGGFFTGLLLLGYLVLAFYAASFGALRTLQRGVRAVSDGDLSHMLRVRGRDEMAQIGGMLETMNRQLSAMVSQVRSSAAHVGMAGQQTADGSLALSARTEEQASALRQTVTAMDEIRNTAADNASRANEIEGLTQGLTRDVEQGGTSMQASVAAMQRLQTATQEVGEIVAVIDDIAFQTGMLALNAAVEASHAGDTGKGFAVVAQEVRQLAQRCAESAERIRQRVGDAEAAVAESGARLQESDAAFTALREGVVRIAAQVQAIASTSDRQHERISEISANVGSLDEITRQNAALVEQASASSRTLVERAESLREAVGSIRLRHGSVDEAHELVRRAVAHLDSVGREQALDDFHDAGGDFIDRDLYVFGLDRDGIYFCFGARPDMIGQSVDDMPGLDGAALVRDAWQQADAGGGWIRYTMVNPITGRPTVKESYVLAIGPNELIGCGVFADAHEAMESATARIPAEA